MEALPGKALGTARGTNRRGRCGRPIARFSEVGEFIVEEMSHDPRFVVHHHTDGVRVLDSFTGRFMDVDQVRAHRTRLELDRAEQVPPTPRVRARSHSGIRSSSNIKLPNPMKLATTAPTVRRGQTVELHLGDCLEVLRSLPDRSVDCVITSPPYWHIRDYGGGKWSGGRKGCDHRPPDKGDRIGTYASKCAKCGATRVEFPLGMEPTPREFVENLCLVFDEVHRVLKDGGGCWVNLGDTRASRAKNVPLDQDLPEGSLWQIPERFAMAMVERGKGWVLRNDLIWHKPSVRPDCAKNRLHVDYEHFYFFTKRTTGYYFDQPTVPSTSMDPKDRDKQRALRSVLSAHSGRNLVGHDSAYPEELIIPLVLSSCPPDGTVLDIFMGTGTTAVVAAHYGRSVIGIEMNPDYWAGAASRCGQATGVPVLMVTSRPRGAKASPPAAPASTATPRSAPVSSRQRVPSNCRVVRGRPSPPVRRDRQSGLLESPHAERAPIRHTGRDISDDHLERSTDAGRLPARRERGLRAAARATSPLRGARLRGLSRAPGRGRRGHSPGHPGVRGARRAGAPGALLPRILGLVRRQLRPGLRRGLGAGSRPGAGVGQLLAA